MRVVLEVGRYMLLFFLFLTIIGAVVQLVFFGLGVDSGIYVWTAMALVIVLLARLYRKKGWGSHVEKPFLWLSISLVILLSVLIPDLSPERVYTTVNVYAYGFPFEFLTLRSGPEMNFLLPNLFSGVYSWNIEPGFFGNFLIWYFGSYFLWKMMKRKQGHAAAKAD